MHYEIEVRTSSGGWLRKGTREKYRRLTDADLAAEHVRTVGGVPRIVRVDDRGLREPLSGDEPRQGMGGPARS